MFERFTDGTRRVIFFARYEACAVGSPHIETEHLLLGLLRQDRDVLSRLRLKGRLDSIREEIQGHSTLRASTHSSVDIPLSNESKRVLAYAAEEAERLSRKYIGTDHLLLGLLREPKSLAASILLGHGLTLESARNSAATAPENTPAARVFSSGSAGAQLARGCMEFVDAATGRRLGITGLGGPVPHIGESVNLPGYGDHRVVDVVYEYSEHIEGAGYNVDRLVAVRVRLHRPGLPVAEPLEST